MSPRLAGLPIVENVRDGAGHGAEVPQVDPGLADHGVQVIVDGESVVGDGGVGHDPHDGAACTVEWRRRGEGGGRHGVDRVGAGRAGDVGDWVVGWSV